MCIYGGLLPVCSECAVRGVSARRLDLLVQLVWIVLPNLPRLRRCADLPHRPRHCGEFRRYRYRCSGERTRLAAITFSLQSHGNVVNRCNSELGRTYGNCDFDNHCSSYYTNHYSRMLEDLDDVSVYLRRFTYVDIIYSWALMPTHPPFEVLSILTLHSNYVPIAQRSVLIHGVYASTCIGS